MNEWTTDQQAENRKMWTAALRSGDYKQGVGVLRSHEGSYCCLGVASELARKAGVINDYNGSQAAPGTAVIEWLGLAGPLGPLVTQRGSHLCVAHLNDSGEWTFDQIADLIDDGGLAVVERA